MGEFEVEPILREFRELLASENDKEVLRVHCQELFAAGIDHEQIVDAILSRMTEFTVGDPSWLPAASFVNLSDSLVHVALQKLDDRHKVMAFGQGRPEFRRLDQPPSVGDTLETSMARFSEAVFANDPQLAERCLLGVMKHAGLKQVFHVLFECLLQPRYLGQTPGPWWAGVRHLAIGNATHLWQIYGDRLAPAVCYVGARHCSKATKPGDEKTDEAIELLETEYATLDAILNSRGTGGDWEEAKFREALKSGDAKTSFAAVTAALRSGVGIDDLQLAILMECVERKIRAAAGSKANWDNLKRESQSTLIIRRAFAIDEKLAAMAAYHAVWQLTRHGDKGLAKSVPVFESPVEIDQNYQIQRVLNGIAMGDALDAMHSVNGYAVGKFEVEELMRRTILWVMEKCYGNAYYAGQRGMIDAWQLAKDHPEGKRVPIALVGWMAAYRNQHFRFKKRYQPVWGANISDDGSLLAVRSGGTRIYDAITGDELMYFRGSPWRFAFSPDSRWVACGWDGGRLQVFDLITRKLVTEWDAFPDDESGKFGEGKFWGLAFSPDGSMLAGAARGNHRVLVWDTATWKLKLELPHDNSRNESVTFSADSQTIATGGNDGTVRIWSAADGSELRVFIEEGRYTAVDFHPDGQHLLGAGSDGNIRVWNWHNGEVTATMSGGDYCNAAAFFEHGKSIISEHEGTIYFWDSSTGEQRNAIEAIPNKLNDHTIFGGANISRDRRTLITAGWHGLVKVWDVEEDGLNERWSVQLELS